MTDSDKLMEDGCWNCKHNDEDDEHPNCQECMHGIDDGWEEA